MTDTPPQNGNPKDRMAQDKTPPDNQDLDRIAINVKAHRLLNRLLDENPELERIMRNSRNETEALIGVRNWITEDLSGSVRAFHNAMKPDRPLFEALAWQDYAAIRILDYIDNAGREFVDPNLRGEIAISNPIRMIWLAVNQGTGGAKPWFFEDMLHLFRQLRGEARPMIPGREQVEKWMERYVSGLDPRIVKLREENRDRIIESLIDAIDRGALTSERFRFDTGMSREQKFLRILDWWDDWRFHLSFAIRDPDLLNEMLGRSLDPDTMKVLYDAKAASIPFFVNPYYLSLLHVRVPYFAVGADLAIRYYVLYSRQLVDEFGHIVAWEKEDKVRPGEPNAAGWLLPSEKSVHRRYPEVAILIPETTGRACGGLCSACQRMFDFQNGHLNFELQKLRPDETWKDRLARYMDYFREDSRLRDILITGGDALMSTDAMLGEILEGILDMARGKREDNAGRAEGEKFAELARVRLGTRMPAYLPQRITPELAGLLADFREKATAEGVRQFVVQTHFESPMEVTPEARLAIRRLLDAGWIVTNQLVFTTAASRRGHTAKLRRILNDVGVLPYYTFTVKGYMENNFHFATNARAVQEQLEEKCHGIPPGDMQDDLGALPDQTSDMVARLEHLRSRANLPFLATDRNVLNLPGVGKSLTYRVIGITRYGRRILEFDHDGTREHSPVIERMGKVVIIESKAIAEYLEQLESLGENTGDYDGLYGYSLGVTEPRQSLFDLPEPQGGLSNQITHLDLSRSDWA